jgi:hypothetical protein
MSIKLEGNPAATNAGGDGRLSSWCAAMHNGHSRLPTWPSATTSPHVAVTSMA